MIRKALILSACLSLAACESKEEATARITKVLPAGCHLIDLGSYPGIDTLVVITCDRADTTTLGGWHTGGGKTRRDYHYAVAMEPAQ